MPSLKLPIAGAARPTQWRSPTELERGFESGAEFPPGAAEIPADATSRRSFVQLLAASAGLATLGGCLKQPEERILPYTRQPEEVVPGNPLHFATASTLGGHAVGLIATSHEGRPTKIEGNPEHPGSRGHTGVLEQATVLSLYDPNRLKVVRFRGQDRSWRDFLTAMAAKARALMAKQGEGLRFLLEPSSSPLILSLRRRLQQTYPQARFSTWSAVPLQQMYDGAQLAFGSALETRTDLGKAQVIASFDADPLCGLPGNAPAMRGWAAKRDPGQGPMNRLYQVEAHLSVTGMNADHRLRVKPTAVQRVALALLGRLADQVPALARYAPLAERFRLDASQSKFVDVLAEDLVRSGADAIVLAGPRQPPVVQAAAHAINSAVSSGAVSWAKPVLHDLDAGPRTLRVLAEEIRRGAVDTLVITAWNPAYGAPADINFGKALSTVPTSAYLAPYEDETAERAGWVLPQSHPLESWADARGHDGTITFVQPLIAPLYASAQEVEVLAALLGEGDRSPYSQLKDFWRNERRDLADFEGTWEKWLADGFIEGTATKGEAVLVRHDGVLAAAQKVAPADPEGLQLNVIPDYRVWDGRFANVGWLQELPDPVTKLTWENAALLSPATARRLKLKQGDLVDLGYLGPPAHAPVVVLPGHADDAVTVSMGCGRRAEAEAIAEGCGFDTATLRHTDEPWFAAGVTLTPLGKKHLLAQTQEHHSMEGRTIAVSTPLSKFPEVEKEVLEEKRGPLETAYPIVDYSRGFKWGMAIDLSKCTGCSACVVACQSENNIPVVGKMQVWRSREMHWLRVDRYFEGNPDAPSAVVPQPLACVHCETAPCEYVCPVYATVHSDEGLNEMVYNRCIGTRYCSNNCPYKVRRFNFFSYTSHYTDTEKMVFNPDVTVRARGVMEKCTYCVQRIERTRIRIRVEGRTLRDGELQTACQQVCPASAIVFGDLNDRDAQVARLHASNRRYDLLHELGTRPRTAYLARITNPNPRLG